MSPAARSVYVFGIYLVVIGGILMGAPNTFLSMFGMPFTTEPWIRVVGVLATAIGILDMVCARAEQIVFMRTTVYTRTFAFIAFTVFVIMGIAPKPLALFGVIDAAAALWTFTALRVTRTVTP